MMSDDRDTVSHGENDSSEKRFAQVETMTSLPPGIRTGFEKIIYVEEVTYD